MDRWVPAKYLRQIIFVLTLWAGVAVTAYGGISGSKHDMSGKGWGTNEICIFCHTPHNANKTVANSPLWNHQVTAVTTYTLYSSPTLHEVPEQPRGPSKLCLSCHDGTVAVDNYGGKTTGTQYIGSIGTGSGLIGTDLSNDHPISIPWNHQTLSGSGGQCSNCHFVHGQMYNPDIPFINGYLECITCHEPHNKYGFSHMTRYTMDKSELCLKCHAK